MRQLTSLGRERLAILLLLSGIAFVTNLTVFFFFYNTTPINILGIAIIFAPLAYYLQLHLSAINTIKKAIRQKIGLEPISAPDMADYGFSILKQNGMTIDAAYKSAGGSIFNKILLFHLDSADGMNVGDRHVIAADYITDKTFLPIALYHSTYVPIGQQRVFLESPDFNKQYAAYSSDEKNVFHELDPDTIHDLTIIKESSKIQFNLEFSNNRVFIFADGPEYIDSQRFSPSFTTVLNGEASGHQMEKFLSMLQIFIEKSDELFKALDA